MPTGTLWSQDIPVLTGNTKDEDGASLQLEH